MHRHSYRGRKFHRQAGPRRALITGLADALIQHRSITTTTARAKQLRPFMEKLVSRATGATLNDRRALIASLSSKRGANTLIDELAPGLAPRRSGFVRIVRAGYRRGDHAPMSTIAFVTNERSPAATATIKKPLPIDSPPTANDTEAPSKQRPDLTRRRQAGASRQ